MAADLVIQGADLPEPALLQIADLTHPSRVSRLNTGAARLHEIALAPDDAAGAALRERLAAACASLRLDFGLVPPGRRLADFGLIAMDMDSTLITIECVDEIADAVGVKPQVAAITAQAMRGEIDFPESLRLRVGLLAGLPAGALESVYAERLRLSPGAEAMLAAARRAGLKTLLVSGGFTFFTSRLKARLALDETIANTLEIIDGKLTGRVLGEIVDGSAKAAKVGSMRASLGLKREQVIVLGDGANDLPMMAEAGVSIAYRAKPVVKAGATYCFDHVGLDGLLNLFPA